MLSIFLCLVAVGLPGPDLLSFTLSLARPLWPVEPWCLTLEACSVALQSHRAPRILFLQVALLHERKVDAQAEGWYMQSQPIQRSFEHRRHGA